MKKLLAIAMTMLMLVLGMAVVASAEDAAEAAPAVEYPTASVTVNGTKVPCGAWGQEAVIIDGRTLVPLRSIFEVLGATVEWNQETKTSTSTLGDITVEVTLGSNIMKKNGADITIDVPAQVINDRTLVPARAITEAFGGNITWDAATRVAAITMDGVEAPKVLFYADADDWDLTDGIIWGDPAKEEVTIKTNPDDPSDKVFHTHGIREDVQNWNYVWVSGIEWEAGKTYLISYNVRADVDSWQGLPVTGGAIGTCVKNDGDYGVWGTYDYTTEEGWRNVTIAYKIEDDAWILQDLFGVYSDPIQVQGTNVGWDFYIDNILIQEYVGPAIEATKDGTTPYDAAIYGIATK